MSCSNIGTYKVQSICVSQLSYGNFLYFTDYFSLYLSMRKGCYVAHLVFKSIQWQQCIKFLHKEANYFLAIQPAILWILYTQLGVFLAFHLSCGHSLIYCFKRGHILICFSYLSISQSHRITQTNFCWKRHLGLLSPTNLWGITTLSTRPQH